MDNHLKSISLKLLIKFFDTKSASSIGLIYILNINLIESGYELKYNSMKKKISIKKGISK